VIAEFDYYGNQALVRKFVYGPGIDEPICMMDGNIMKRYEVSPEPPRIW